MNLSRISLLALVAALAALAPLSSTRAEEIEPHDGIALCQPGVHQDEPPGCLSLGPATYFERMAEAGIEFPLQPVPGVAPSPELTAVPNLYARVVSNGAPIFASLEDAHKGEPEASWMEAGFDFVTYIDRQEINNHIYYMIEAGAWMRGGDLSRIGAMPSFQGMQILATPANDFGWVLFETNSKRTPGFQGDDYTGRTYYRYHPVQIYAVEVVEEMDWVLIGPDEWVQGRHVSGVTPNPIPPEGVTNGRWVEVNLAEQTLAVYEDAKMVFATVMSSGIPGQWTQPGLFQAYQKKENETMRGAFEADRSDFYYLEGVPWTIYFDQARAIHGTYWHNSFGVPTSRGCVNLSPGDAHWVFDWIQEGDWVYVHDPTGQTPTDPALYGAGGA